MSISNGGMCISNEYLCLNTYLPAAAAAATADDVIKCNVS